MAGQLETYRQEVLRFLKTCSIKFEPFAYIMGESYMNAHGIDDPNGAWNPYYLNLCGEYSENDTRMTVYSVEEERHVAFDKDFATNYPKSAQFYRVGTIEYDALLERYPSNADLIKCIVYPPESMESVLKAENLSLVAYDASFLQPNERESLVSCLKRFLQEVRTRWWVKEFCYEDMYSITFWVMLWQHLPNLLLTQRFRNIKTPFVHPFHIWEYLKSKGLKDYRDVLTDKQSLWLYRNIDYILKNKGKHDTLLKLAENLLSEVYVSLHYVDMYQETASKWDDQLVTTPRFKYFNLLTGAEDKEEDFALLNAKLVEVEIEDRDNAEYVAETDIALGTQNHNILPTKFLEFKKDPVNTTRERFMVNFFLDTLLYRYSEGTLVYNVVINSPLDNTKIEIPVGDAIALWYWTVLRGVGYAGPEKLPTRFRTHIAFQRLEPREREYPQYIYHYGHRYDYRSIIELSKILISIPWFEKTFPSDISFMETTVGQFRALLNLVRHIELSNHMLYHEAMGVFFDKFMVNTYVPLHLSDCVTYEEWLATTPQVKTIVDQLEEMTGDQQSGYYNKFCQNCFEALFPMDLSIKEEFLGKIRYLDRIYTAIRDLFISLGSYNITYLETDRLRHEYLIFRDPDFYHVSQENHYGLFFYLFYLGLAFKDTSFHDPNFEDLLINISGTMGAVSEHNYQRFELGYDLYKGHKDTWHMRKTLPDGPFVRWTRMNSSLKPRICTNEITTRHHLTED